MVLETVVRENGVLAAQGDLKPVEGAEITCDGCAQTRVRADANGHFTLDLGSPHATKTLHVVAPGFAPAEMDVPPAARGTEHPPPLFLVLMKRVAEATAASVPESTIPETPCEIIIGRMHASGAIVRVDALEHLSPGVVVGSPDRVLVPFSAVEVDRPGRAIDVYDVRGDLHHATVAATDRQAGLALLALDRPIDAAPLEVSHQKESRCYATIQRFLFWPLGQAARGPVADWQCWSVIATSRREPIALPASGGSDQVDAPCKQAPTDRGEHVTDKMIDGPDLVAFDAAKSCLRARKDMLGCAWRQYDSVSEMYSP